MVVHILPPVLRVQELRATMPKHKKICLSTCGDNNSYSQVFELLSNHLQKMKENSGEEYMLSPKVSRHANWGSIPCRKSACVQSRNREQEKSRIILKDCKAVAESCFTKGSKCCDIEARRCKLLTT
ncbi:hypothetical protein CMV_011377 [Castanea mollissima]|uniref:Uncharacterized protein n=1 Tax=Castanea mollissima TaxID=60419 RepID=A0A8J4RD44_9ROSI|nr:hypothetical protein CMV_011377 [Castanea mollissima]